MDQDKFEELIKPFAEKVDDSRVPEYKIRRIGRTRTYRLGDPEPLEKKEKKSRPNYGLKVITPAGVFASIADASTFHNLTYNIARYRCIHNLHGWSFKDE